MTRYTFVLDWHVGTYVAQASGTDVGAALGAWARSTSDEDDLARVRAAFLDRRAVGEPVLLEGLLGVWCVSADVDGLALSHIIEGP